MRTEATSYTASTAHSSYNHNCHRSEIRSPHSRFPLHTVYGIYTPFLKDSQIKSNPQIPQKPDRSGKWEAPPVITGWVAITETSSAARFSLLRSCTERALRAWWSVANISCRKWRKLPCQSCSLFRTLSVTSEWFSWWHLSTSPPLLLKKPSYSVRISSLLLFHHSGYDVMRNQYWTYDIHTDLLAFIGDVVDGYAARYFNQCNTITFWWTSLCRQIISWWNFRKLRLNFWWTFGYDNWSCEHLWLSGDRVPFVSYIPLLLRESHNSWHFKSLVACYEVMVFQA